MSKELTDRYAAGAGNLAMAIRGLSREDLHWKPPADAGVGLWSIREIIVHLADDECVMADRMKRVITEDNPTLLAFDEKKWAAKLAYDKQSVEDALELVGLIRKQMAVILQNVPASAWQRAGTHTERGRLTLADLVDGVQKHLEHHLEFVHAKRRKMGKEMW